MRLWFALLALLWMGAPASAQLPSVGVPSLPDIGGAVGGQPVIGQTLGEVRDLTRVRANTLLRQYRRELERDPNGQAVVRSQILGTGLSDAAIAQARARGFQVVRVDPIDDTTSLVVLRAPAGVSTRQALRRVRAADPQGVYDFDHLHFESGPGSAPGPPLVGGGSSGPRIGMIDSGVRADVPVAAQRAFASAAAVPAEHGTAIATLLRESASGARLYVADIYGGAPAGGASSGLARALAWLAQESVPVINVSLVGPRNRVVEAIISRMLARGFVIVAAVGNDGPAAAPLFPASYEGVIGVTGVDARGRVLVEAARGPQVDFAALGVLGRERGTSYAAPIASAFLAARVNAAEVSLFQHALAAMRSAARDAGAAGRDDVYGFGIISAP